MEIEATYGLSTPLFCSGPDQGQAELRLPSFKGALRYWWRALAWSHYEGRLETIQTHENAVFGAAAVGQSRVSMRLLPQKENTRQRQETCKEGDVLTTPRPGIGKGPVVGPGARYLGSWVMEAFASRKKGTEAGQLTRACLEAPWEFTIALRGHGLNADHRQLLEDALIALGTMGGMGSKSRKGYGSLVLKSLCIDGEQRWDAPQSIGALRKIIDDRFSRYRQDPTLPQFTAFSGGVRHVLVSSNETEPLKLLDLIGRELVRYRSWGRGGKTAVDTDSEKNFKDDHDLMKQPERKRNTHPRRIAFGLPHNYGNKSWDLVGPGDPKLDRRASPLFIHIHQCGAQPVAVLSFLPAQFLPWPNEKHPPQISVGGKRVPQKPEAELYKPIHAFLDRLLDPDPEKRKEPFTNALEVRRL